MKTTYIMDDAQWGVLVQDTAYYFDDLTLKRGFQYYKQGRVLQFSMSSPPIIKAVVEGREEYRVKINLEAFSLNHCDCPVHGPCKHMAAVLLNFADWQNRSIPVLVNAKASAMSAAIPKPSKNPQSALKETASLIPTMTVTEWHGWFERCVAPLSQQVRNPQYIEGGLALIFKIKPSLSPVTEQLFRLHAQLFMLEMLTKPARNQSHSFGTYVGYYTHLAISELQSTIEHSFESALPLDKEPEQWRRVTETLAYLRNEMLTETRDPSYFSPCYALFWRNWIIPNLNDRLLFSEELEKLQQLEKKLGTSLSRRSWLLAQSLMHFQLSQDQAAWSLLRSAAERPDFHPEDLMGFLAPLADARDWPRLVAWLVEIGAILSGRLFYRLEEYSFYWDQAVKELPDTEPQMWNALTAMLPSSRDMYDEKLLSHSKYQEWMDYQLSAGREPAHFRVTKLQPLEKHAPETLLPFYHQAVERYVSEKNRDSYKAAVKLMKRLQKLYKKMKQEERWASFLNVFTVRHSRLRALQEELRKGKMIP
ncbi:SWIM zinc finger family protein [Paenibacillus sp. BR2-3]|uniref:SWIM zinc finger family protein n=1 Tax=Paenibacillus sp. BR2-3 TaxID=3048494 RepID=UPI0039777E72